MASTVLQSRAGGYRAEMDAAERASRDEIMVGASVISAALIIFAFASAPFRRSPGQVAAGLVIGLLVAAGWFASGYLGADDFNPAPVVSLTFIAPIADAMQYVMLSTGSTLNFGIATVGGVLAGSLITALATGRFHLEGYQSPRHMHEMMSPKGRITTLIRQLFERTA